MRAALVCVLACCIGCTDKEPNLTLAELPDLGVFVAAWEQPWTSVDPPGESHVLISVHVFHDYDKRTCPVLDASLAASANGIPLTDIELGGYDSHDSCDTPSARATLVQAAGVDTDLDVVIGDRTRSVHMTLPGLMKRSTLSVVEPLGAIAPAAKVRLTWTPEVLVDVRSDNVQTTFTQLAPPYTEHETGTGYAFVEGNEIRLSIPDNLTWTGPTQLAISRIALPYVQAPCEVEVCTGQRTAAATVTIDLQ